MRYRRLTDDGDYSFGQSAQDFLGLSEAIGQAIKTRLTLDKGSFWRDLEAGLPLSTQILGSPGSEANILAIDGIIKNEILGTEGVIGLPSYSSSFVSETREYRYTATINTIYSTFTFQGSI